jgi:hypothetical protein
MLDMLDPFPPEQDELYLPTGSGAPTREVTLVTQ